ncbi:metal dependent phosphohydrolase [Sulfurimonas gotlandica GD1]|jgi:HD-GYP domain-containing protein (c-di-GMP phosphodiesterase class II)|uniref:Metal dependent phosphohydrolase n=2 Tax=Sulfurimonas TaxID=202746 RepID=H1FRW6_SULGG|nr:metal dependent phosphohydrolase [Sulfurimonas gotlandica GD1]
MNNAKNMNSIYLGFANDEYYQVINLKDNELLKKLHNSPKDSHWAVVSAIGEGDSRVKSAEFLDKNLNILSTRSVKATLRPTTRDWYKTAMASDEVIRTDVYKFNSTKTYGLTFSKRVRDTGIVLSTDFTLERLSQFLSTQNFDKNSYIMLYDNNGEKIASSRALEINIWNKVFSIFKTLPANKTHTINEKNIDYFVYHTLSNIDENNNMHIGIVIPRDDLLAPYMKMITYSIYAAIAFVLLTIPLVLYSTSLIVKPIRALMAENEKIIERKFGEVIHIKTNITELDELSTSFVNMSQSIQEYQKAQEKLLDSIIQIIADAIDAKSPYTGGHCKRVPEIAEMLTRVASETNDGVFKEFSFNTEDEWREFHLGAWLHDCGKVTTPEYVVDKATKLETINNRIHEIRTRFEVLFRDTQITYLESQLKGENKEEALEKMQNTQKQLMGDFNFIATSNIGGEYMSADKQERIRIIGKKEWIRNFDERLGLSDVELLRYEGIEEKPAPYKEKLLSDKKEHLVKRENFDFESYEADGFKDEVPEHLYNYGELYNLCLEKGTLTHEERFKINEHVIMSIKMLEQLPFPSHLTKIPEYAGTHHETLIGTGYPRRLTKNELSIPARIMAIADIFEALTASDRPYKKAKTLSESLKIMTFMVKDEHIDSDLFDLFLESGIYLDYAKKHLKPEQIDEIDINKYRSS